MTKDEIEKRAVECFDTHTDQYRDVSPYASTDIQRVAKAIREAVVKAVSDHECGDYDGCEFCDKTISEQHTFNVCGPCYNDALAAAIVAARAYAFEEAAQRAESLAGLEPWYDTHGSEVGEAKAIAFAIRALKDSLNTPQATEAITCDHHFMAAPPEVVRSTDYCIKCDLIRIRGSMPAVT